MAKLPWLKFYPSWWMGDSQLTKCSPATRGIWMDLICAMHQADRSGELCGTTDQIARYARCSTVELTHALSELQITGTADVTFRNNNVTVINRLMKREAKSRVDTALRVQKHRINAKCNVGDTGKKKEDRSKKKEIIQGDKPPVELRNIQMPFQSDLFIAGWQRWKSYKKTEHRFSYKSVESETSALSKLAELSGNNEDNALAIITQSIENGWKGFFPLKGGNLITPVEKQGLTARELQEQRSLEILNGLKNGG